MGVESRMESDEVSTVFWEIWESLRFRLTVSFVHSFLCPMAISFVETNWGFKLDSLWELLVLKVWQAVVGQGI